MGDVECVLVSGNTATVSGVITNVSEEIPGFLFVGQRFAFTVADNGEGSSASSDLVSDVVLGDEASCANGELVPYLPLQGNVQVSQD
jgi:hypothetical protein